MKVFISPLFTELQDAISFYMHNTFNIANPSCIQDICHDFEPNYCLVHHRVSLAKQ